MVELFNNLSWNKKIEVLRTIKGWSQEKAAEKCYTGQRTYWAMGKWTMHIHVKIVDEQ